MVAYYLSQILCISACKQRETERGGCFIQVQDVKKYTPLRTCTRWLYLMPYRVTTILRPIQVVLCYQAQIWVGIISYCYWRH